MLSKNLENSPSYDIVYKFLEKARVYYTLSISRGGGQAPPGFATVTITLVDSPQFSLALAKWCSGAGTHRNGVPTKENEGELHTLPCRICCLLS